MTYENGLALAEENGVIVNEYESPFKSFSVVIESTYAIAINHSALEPGEDTTALFHELGHCATDSFYNEFSPCDVRQRHENRADKWAIKKLVPEDELDQAVTDGCNTLYALAERFNVTEDFMRKAVCWYTHGNLTAELYF